MKRTIGKYNNLQSFLNVVKKWFGAKLAMAFSIIGIDISKWNGEMNFDVVEMKSRFVYMRAGHGTLTDPWYIANRKACVERKIPWGIYWFIYVGQNLEAQAQAFINHIKGGGWILPPVADFEATTLDTAGTTAFIKRFMEIVQAECPVKMMIYTGPGWWNAKVQRNTWANKYHLWVAHWTSADQPILPKDWQRALFWQYSADGNNKGREYGSIDGDYDMDLNRFMGEPSDWARLIGYNDEEPEPEEPAGKYKVLFPNLMIRSGPGTQYPALGKRVEGEIIEAEDYNLWVKDAKGWSAVRHAQKDYMK